MDREGGSGREGLIISTGMFTSFLFEESFGLVVRGEVKGEGKWVVSPNRRENTVTVTSPSISRT